jgi:uncharacterized SAM-binding protein YcdF (DUF218 family)
MTAPYDAITDFIFVEGPTDPAAVEPADVILVPGGSAPAQMQRAVALYRAEVAPWVLPSGGVNPRLDRWPTEWAYYQHFAVAAGVPARAILKEDRATNTLENARFSWAVLQARGIPVARAVLVTKAHHARRALLTYQAVFPRGVAFVVSPIVDYRDIRRDTWFRDRRTRHYVFEELRKIGTYLEALADGWDRS